MQTLTAIGEPRKNHTQKVKTRVAASPKKESKVHLEDRMTGWIKALMSPALADHSKDLISAFNGTRAEILGKVKRAGLPHIPFVCRSVDSFVGSDLDLELPLNGEKYYWVIEPNASLSNDWLNKPKPRIGTTKDLLEDVKSYKLKNPGIAATVTVSECADIKYMGSITVNDEGYIHAEFNDAPIPTTRNGVTPPYRVSRHFFFDTFEYSFEDRKLRSAIYKSIMAIPHTGSGRTLSWEPGYYEVMLVLNNDGYTLSPAFYDLRNERAYLTLPSLKLT